MKDNKRFLKHCRKFPWRRVLTLIKRRCNSITEINYKYYGGKGIQCLITSEELRFLWFRDNAKDMKRPSIDRINNDGHYELSNCRFIELSENISKTSSKPILQYSKEGIFIREWNSIQKASKELKINRQCISDCIRLIQLTAGGFKWKYK